MRNKQVTKYLKYKLYSLKVIRLSKIMYNNYNYDKLN